MQNSTSPEAKSEAQKHPTSEVVEMKEAEVEVKEEQVEVKAKVVAKK